MLKSCFLIADSEVLVEHHYLGVLSRDICTQFLDHISGYTNPSQVPPILQVEEHFIAHITRDETTFMAVLDGDNFPLMAIEFLNRLAMTIRKFFKSCNAGTIKKHFIKVYQLLDEMCDGGIPLNTETNILSILVPPKTDPAQLELPSEATSAISWRSTGIKHTRNEIFFDVEEYVDLVIGPDNLTRAANLYGYIFCHSFLSGMPDVLVSFDDPSLITSASIHPCVRHRPFEQKKHLSFIPPDGRFRLMAYRARMQPHAVPVYMSVEPRISGGRGRIEVVVGTKGRQMPDKVKVIVPLTEFEATSIERTHGKHQVTRGGREIEWTISKMPETGNSKLVLTVEPVPGVESPRLPVARMQFEVQKLAVSGIKLARVEISGESYKVNKGVKYVSKSLGVEYRT
eukprot:gnl/Dysnectes_brevis/1844_a2116_2242.p1 GENE.gnl/Dysnectes_brevis/1844_a2116_2242~~gnl/Dysnectes_brevis/1844_a2116_2242.p1  ORF type:complete len:399 (-),score=113.10 gnl/Dysnectes_brevis/1844_a2116_2242:80-1276(-)